MQLARIHLGDKSVECPRCAALRFPCEGVGFCCGEGKHVVDFATYYRPPGDNLLKLFSSTWPYTDAKGNAVHDVRANAPRLTGFGAMSRRYNNLFSLAMHEIQSTNAERELRFGNELRPSNIRIHGTMYRRIWSCADATPLRYLVVDPLERASRAKEQRLDMKLLPRLEKAIVPHNAYMQELRRLSSSATRTPAASIELSWDEGLHEVAAIVHESSDHRATARSVLFRRTAAQQPQYLHPLNALYEPLSYPLWYPFGGRGWSPEAKATSGQHVTQMWWYRQQLLRLPHMHLCGRLLNEWLVNMFCRMEDERLSLLRREQQTRIATRAELSEVVTNELRDAATVGKTYYLPCSVPGSPRHLKRLRIDALELARRKGPPTYFITLTCNPYWPEIMASLHAGQTAADRPDIVVRVFHARLEKLMAYLKADFCGARRYVISAIEYQPESGPTLVLGPNSFSGPTSVLGIIPFVASVGAFIITLLLSYKILKGKKI